MADLSARMRNAPIPSPTARVHDQLLRGKKAWTRETLREADWLLPIPEACLAELERFVAVLGANPLQTELLSPDDYDLPRTRAFMGKVKKGLDDGVGFAVLDRLPVDGFGKAAATAVYWILSALIARPVAQAFKGTMLYDVIDTGQRKSPTVRADLTRDELDFHTDYGYNRPPVYFGLQTLRTARRGGQSSVASLYAAHNLLRQSEPRLLDRLYRPFWLNRYGEHAPGDPPASFHPVFTVENGEPWGRFNPRNIYAGYELMGEELDAEGRAAIEALHAALSDPANRIDFDLEPGQTVYLRNGRCAHRRSEYEDWPEPDRRRHMVRIFLRDEGARSYDG